MTSLSQTRFRLLPAVLLVALLAMAVTPCHAAGNAVGVGLPSPWIVPQTFQRPDVFGGGTAQDYRWLLSDRQIKPQTDEVFIHEVRQPLTAAGVDYASHVLINYDPACQLLTFHWARVWRGANKLDRLDLSRLRPGPAGPGRGSFLFASEKTAILVLDDVRAGDIVDYAYTIEGVNPALNGKFFDTVRLQFIEPVDRVVTRLVWPASRQFYIKNHLTNIRPAVSIKGGESEYTWTALNVPGLRLEPLTPAWYDPYPSVQLSELQKWSDVSDWASRFFSATNSPSPDMAVMIDAWKKLPQPAGRALAALRLVQQGIRNPGPDDKPSGYEPARPSVVFSRGYGDEKEKALLLVTFLRALNLEAYPLLVNDALRQQLANYEPSATLLNRVLVQLKLDGRSYFLDPTATYQRGALPLRSWNNDAWGLPVGPRVTALSPIPACPVEPLTTVREYFYLVGTNSPSTIRIVTVAEGPDADALRARFATTPLEDVERENLEGYAKLYPSIRRAEPMTYSDDEERNRMETTEVYTTDKIWDWAPRELLYFCHVYAANVGEALVTPPTAARVMPYSVRFPVHQVFHAEINLNTALPGDMERTTINDPAFYFHRAPALAGSTLTVNYEYRSWTNFVAPGAMPAYVLDMGAAAKAMNYSVTGGW